MRVTNKGNMTFLAKFYERIFKVLGMKHTFFREVASQIIKNRVIGYCGRPLRNSDSKYFTIHANNTERYFINMSGMEITGDDGVWSTINDLYLWDQNFYTNKLGGGQDLIKRYTAQGTLNNGEKINYAYGIESTTSSEGQKLSHAGFVCGYPCVQVQFPAEKLSIIILSNHTKLLPWEYIDKIKSILAD